jgi:hypothetical protein
LKEIKDLNKQKDTPWSKLLANMTIVYELIYTFYIILLKIHWASLQADPKKHMEIQGSKITNEEVGES